MRVNVRVQFAQAVAALNSVVGQIGALERAADKASNGASRFGNAYSNAFSSITLQAKRLGQSGRILLYNFTLPLVAGFAVLERQFLKTSQAGALLRQVYTTSGNEAFQFGKANDAVGKDLAALDKIALILSNEFGYMKSEVLDLMVTFGRAGQSGVALAQSTELALRIARAYQVDFPKAADAILTVANAWQLTGKQTEVAMAIIGAVSQQTRADVETVSAAMVKAAPPAQQLGMTVRDLAAMIGVLQQAGFKGAESGTALNFMLTRLTKVTPEASRVLKAVGVDVNATAWATATATEKFKTIAKSLADATNNQRAYALAVIFGARQNPKAVAFFSDYNRVLSVHARLLESTASSTQLLARMDNDLVTSMDNASVKFQIMKVQIVNSLMVIAAQLTPALLALTNMLVRAATWFGNLGDTARGRTIQAMIIMTGVVLAAAGPLAILVSSIGVLVGMLGTLAGAAGTAAVAMASPWGLVAGALVGLLVVAIKFRDEFIAVFRSLAVAVFRIAMLIYEAFQWMNPFARHSPSLVERTRDAVAAMITYWNGARPILRFYDEAARSITKFRDATAAFTHAQQAAANVKVRQDIKRVSGNAGVKAYDAAYAANNRLAAQLPKIEAQYNAQAKVVDKAKAALDKANGAVDAASKKLEMLRRTQRDLQKMSEKIGDAKGLRSQADAASQMARQLAEAGNTDLAKRFSAQAAALNTQADRASQVETQLGAINDQIDAQSDAVDALTDKRDALQATYDTEINKLQALADGYHAVEDAVRDNQKALDDMAASARAAIEAAEAAARKAAKAGKGAKGKPDPLAGFNAAGAGSFPEVTGASAVPSMPGGGGVPSMDQFIADAQQRAAKMMENLFPDPVKAVNGFFDKISSAAHGKLDPIVQWIKDKWHGLVTDTWSSVGGLVEAPSGFGRAIDTAKGALDNFLGSANSVHIEGKGWVEAPNGFIRLIDSLPGKVKNLGQAIAGPLEPLRDKFRELLDAVGGALREIVAIGRDVGDLFGDFLVKSASIFTNFWKENGDSIAKILGVIAWLVMDTAEFFLKLGTVVAKVVWPIVRLLLSGILDLIRGVMEMLSGLVGFLASVFTGDWKSAWENLKTIAHGALTALWGLVKTIVGAIGSLFVVMVGYIIGAVVGGLGVILSKFASFLPKLASKIIPGLRFVAEQFGRLGSWIAEKVGGLATEVGPVFADFVRSIPRMMWDAFRAAWDAAWRLVDYAGEWLSSVNTGWTAKFQALVEELPRKMWDTFTGAFAESWDLVKFVGERIVGWTADVGKAFGEFGKKIPGWLWDGLKSAWGQTWKFGEWIGSKVAEYAPGVTAQLSTFGKKFPEALWNGLKAIWSNYWKFNEFLSTQIDTYAPGVLAKMTEFGGKIPGWLWSGFKTVFSTVWKFAEWIGSHLDDVGGVIKNAASSAGRWIVQKIIEGLKNMLDDAFKLAQWLGEDIDRAARGIADEALELGKDLVRGIIKGIKALGSGIKDAVVGAVGDAYGKAKDVFHIGSPSRVFAEGIGVPIATGIALGISRQADSITDATLAAVRDAASAVDANVSLPVLTQLVRLQYLDTPMTSAPNLAGQVRGSDGAAVLGMGGATTIVHQNLDVTMNAAESTDPHAVGQVLAWKLKSGF